MEKPLSQRIAHYLEIINYILLIPLSLIELLVIVFSLVFLLVGQIFVLFFGLAFTVIFAFGVLLQYGYYKHARGEISLESAGLLWVGTLVFNFIPATLLLWGWSRNNFSVTNEGSFWFYNLLGFYLLITGFAIAALIDVLRHQRLTP